MIGDWLLTLRDRVSYMPHLLPYLLGALADDCASVAAAAAAALEGLGGQYEADHADELEEAAAHLPTEAHSLGSWLPPGLSARLYTDGNPANN